MMGKYVEFGIGNTWIVRTEFENKDGTEYEVKGVSGKICIKSVYVRLWMAKKVMIIDSSEGIKFSKKKRNAFKLVFGIHSEV
jgi:hypothetical protein